jgi:hypothetical protein
MPTEVVVVQKREQSQNEQQGEKQKQPEQAQPDITTLPLNQRLQTGNTVISINAGVYDEFRSLMSRGDEDTLRTVLASVSPEGAGRVGKRRQVGRTYRIGSVASYKQQVGFYASFRKRMSKWAQQLGEISEAADMLYPRNVVENAVENNAYLPLVYIKRGYGMLPRSVVEGNTISGDEINLATGITDTGDPAVTTVSLSVSTNYTYSSGYIEKVSLNLDNEVYDVVRYRDVQEFLKGKHIAETEDNSVLEYFSAAPFTLNTAATDDDFDTWGKAGDAYFRLELSRYYADHESSTDSSSLQMAATCMISMLASGKVSKIVVNGIITERVGMHPLLEIVPKLITRISPSVARVGSLAPNLKFDSTIDRFAAPTPSDMNALGEMVANKFHLYDVAEAERKRIAGRLASHNPWFGIRKFSTPKKYAVDAFFIRGDDDEIVVQSEATALGVSNVTSQVVLGSYNVDRAFEGGKDSLHILMCSGIEFPAVKDLYASEKAVCMRAVDMLINWLAQLIFRMGGVEEVVYEEDDSDANNSPQKIRFRLSTLSIRAALHYATYISQRDVSLPTTRSVTYAGRFSLPTDRGESKWAADIAEIAPKVIHDALKPLIYSALLAEMSHAVIYDGRDVIHATKHASVNMRNALPVGDFVNIQLARIGFSMVYALLWNDKTLFRRVPNLQVALMTVPLSLTASGLLVYELTSAIKRVFSRYYRSSRVRSISEIADTIYETNVLGKTTEPLTIVDEEDVDNAQVHLMIRMSPRRYGLDNIIQGMINVIRQTPRVGNQTGMVYTPFFLIVVIITNSAIDVYVEPEPRLSQILVSARNRVYDPSSHSLQSRGGTLSALIAYLESTQE